jgi:hypothetical protein
MDKFLVLYNSPTPAAEMMASVTPEQAETGMAEWTAWADMNHDAIVDLGVPLGSGRHHFHTPGGTIDVLEFIQIPGM